MATVITFQPVCAAPGPAAVVQGVQLAPGGRPILPPLPPSWHLFDLPPGPWYTVFGYGGFWAVQLASFLVSGVANLIVRDQRFHEDFFGGGGTDGGGGALPESVQLVCTSGPSVQCGIRAPWGSQMGFTLTSSEKALLGKQYQLYWYNETKADGKGFHPYPDGYAINLDGYQYLGVVSPTAPPQTPTLLIPQTATGGLASWAACTLQFYAQSVDDPTKQSATISVLLYY